MNQEYARVSIEMPENDTKKTLHHELTYEVENPDIQDEYTFEYRSPQQMDDSVLYAEPTLQGNAVITRRQEGDAETQVNLELLFNYKTQNK